MSHRMKRDWSVSRLLQLQLLVLCSLFFAGGLFGQQDGKANKAKFPADLPYRAPESIEELKQLETRVQQVLAKVESATVALSNGSGVVVSKDGYILTAAHVNREAGRRVRITFSDGRRVWGETLGNNHGSDYGLVKISAEGDWPFVEMGSSKDCKRGQWCVAVGFPVTYTRGTQPPARLGRILRTSSRSIMTDCTIMGGDSGGPLFDLNGKVIGIHSRVNESIGQNYHVPVDSYRDGWDRLASAEDWNRPRSRRGREGQDSDSKPAYLGVRRTENTQAAIVSYVTPGSAAAEAGIQAGDLILKFHRQEVESFDQLVQLVAARRAGDRTRVEVRRGDDVLRLRLQLGSRQ